MDSICSLFAEHPIAGPHARETTQQVSLFRIVDFPVYDTTTQTYKAFGDDSVLYALAIRDNADRSFLVPLLLAVSCISQTRVSTSHGWLSQLENYAASWWSSFIDEHIPFVRTLSKLMFIAIEDRKWHRTNEDTVASHVDVGRDILDHKRRRSLFPPFFLLRMTLFTTIAGAMVAAIRQSLVVDFGDDSHLTCQASSSRLHGSYRKGNQIQAYPRTYSTTFLLQT